MMLKLPSIVSEGYLFPEDWPLLRLIIPCFYKMPHLKVLSRIPNPVFSVEQVLGTLSVLNVN